jgi:hypothetical protein
MADRYWIKNSAGDWNNIANWSDSPGGSGGFSVPGPSDNVYFDSNGTGLCTVDISVLIQLMDMTNGSIKFNGKRFETLGNLKIRGDAVATPTGLNNSFIVVGGDLTLTGKQTAYMDLLATAPWDLTVTGIANVQFVNVANSNASRGSTIMAAKCGDGLFNNNWSISPMPTLEEPKSETITLTGADISNKYVLLNRTPVAASEVAVSVVKGSSQIYGIDYYAIDNQLRWDGKTLDGILSSGDQLSVIYSVDNCLNFFKLTPVRNSRRVVSRINKEVLLEMTALAGNGYFNSASKITRVDIIYEDNNFRERKRVIHVGQNLEGQTFWSETASSGLWRKMRARVRDTDGAELFIERDVIGAEQDLTLA